MWDWFAKLDPNWQTFIWLASIAALTNVACAVLGCYLLLRRMSLLGDAISHAVLPGLVLAYVFSGTLNIFYLFLGAVLFGLLTAFLTELIHRHGRVAEDTSMGVVFTSLFALGVILIKQYGQTVDLDPDCVLNGVLELADDNLWTFWGYELPRGLVVIGAVALANLLFVIIFWKELLITVFDPALGDAMGFRTALINYALMGLVALTTVASFEQVGSILVVAMLVVPGATAHLLCNRLTTMIIVASAIAAVSGLLGLCLALWLDVNAAGAGAVVVGGLYVLALLFAPREGVVSKAVRNFLHRLTILREDVLAIVYRAEESKPQVPVTVGALCRSLASNAKTKVAITWARMKGELELQRGQVVLTPKGRRQAARVIRAHRLWERFLAEELLLAEDHLHEPAMRMEHYIDQQLEEQLAQSLGQPQHDPHGRRIPDTDTSSSDGQ